VARVAGTAAGGAGTVGVADLVRQAVMIPRMARTSRATHQAPSQGETQGGQCQGEHPPARVWSWRGREKYRPNFGGSRAVRRCRPTGPP
jgi:hypothetical protein